MIFGNPVNAYMNEKLAGMRIPTSLLGKAIAVVYGTQRLPWNLIWYGDFKAVPASQAQGGKGGLGGGLTKGESYVYYSAVQGCLCCGPIQQIGNVWDSQGILLIKKTTTVVVVPSVGPYTVTVTPPGSGSYAADIGSSLTAAYSVTANDYGSPGPITYAGSQDVPLVKVPGTPQAGQYSVTINTGPPQTATYTFNAAQAGETIEISYSWQDPSQVTGAKTDPASVLNLTLFTGAQGQAPWGYLVTNHPGQALGYTLLAHLDSPSLYLGPAGVLPGFTFEVLGRQIFGGSIVDCDPSAILEDLLTDPFFGQGWTPADLDLGNIGGTWANWSDYCVANSIFCSLLLASQETGSSILDRIFKLSNAEMFASGPYMKAVSYGDTTAVGNGAQFTPMTAPIVDLDDDDYVTDIEPGVEQTQDPVEVPTPTILDAFNDLYLEYYERTNGYNPEIIEAKDDASIAQIGVRTAPAVSMHDICSQQVASQVAQTILQRSVYIRQKYNVKIPSQYRYLEPMDLVTLTDAELGLNKTPVRILSIEEDENWDLSIEAEEFPWGTAAPTLYPKQINSGQGVNSSTLPGNINPPIIFEANNRITVQIGYTIAFGISGELLSAWGGCNVWMSEDGTNYKQIGTINGPARMGVLTASFPAGSDPDTVNTCSVDLTESAGELTTATNADADADRTICLVGSGASFEIISYSTATLTSQSQYNLTTYIRRGQLSSPILSHSSGDPFLRLDAAVFQWTYDATMIGKPLYFKFTSFNTSGQMEQSLAEVTQYTITPTGDQIGLLTPAHSTYRPASNPLTAFDAGTSATIDIASFIMLVPGTSIDENSGAITGLLYNTLYYVYFDDPTWQGGNVVYQVTTTKETALDVAGRYFVGSIYTPQQGGQPTVGNNDGGGGAQNGVLTRIGFGLYAATASGSGSLSDLNLAIDGNETTFGTISIGTGSGSVAADFYLPAGITQRFSSLTLKVLRSLSNTLSGATADVYTLSWGNQGYSAPPGTSGSFPIESANAGVPLSLAVVSVNLLGINLPFPTPSNVVLEAALSDSGVASGAAQLDIYEAWIEAIQ